MTDDDLPPGFAAFLEPPTVTVRFEWRRPPFRAYWRWNGVERSVSRWTPWAARDRAYVLYAPRIERAIDQWFEDDRAARLREVRWRQLAEVIGKGKATELFMKVNKEWP